MATGPPTGTRGGGTVAGHDVVGTLIATRGRALTGYAYLLCGDVGDAEDLVQDALVKTFSRRRAGLELGSAEAYVRRAILTTYVDGWRRRGRWSERLHLVATRDSSDGPEVTVPTQVDVVAALRTLPRRQRACVVLRFYEDLTVAEIAEQLGVSVGAVKRYLSMGVHALEDRLGPVVDADTHIDMVQEV